MARSQRYPRGPRKNKKEEELVQERGLSMRNMSEWIAFGENEGVVVYC